MAQIHKIPTRPNFLYNWYVAASLAPAPKALSTLLQPLRQGHILEKWNFYNNILSCSKSSVVSTVCSSASPTLVIRIKRSRINSIRGLSPSMQAFHLLQRNEKETQPLPPRFVLRLGTWQSGCHHGSNFTIEGYTFVFPLSHHKVSLFFLFCQVLI